MKKRDKISLTMGQSVKIEQLNSEVQQFYLTRLFLVKNALDAFDKQTSEKDLTRWMRNKLNDQNFRWWITIQK